MRRISLWFLSTVSAVVLLFGYHTSTQGALSAGGATTPAFSGSLAGSASGSASDSTEDPTSSTTTSGAGAGGDDTADSGAGSTTGAATLTGDVVDTRWGPVQVELTVTDGAITDVSVLQYPQGNHEDEEINAYALPILIDETLQAQSAEIDMVSGATVTSEGYLDSLQSALDQA